MAELIRIQARACQRLGSPFYGALLDDLAADVLLDGPAAAVLAGHEEDPGPSALALRLAGSVHRMVLAGEAPELAAHYPSAGGDGDPVAAWPVFRALLAAQPLEVAGGLHNPPQTNEVGRAAALFGGLLNVAGPDPMPVRLLEIGAAAGLNLRSDRFRYRTQSGSVWGPLSPVELDPAWDVRPTETASLIRVVERRGADLAPIDPATDEGAIRLASYVWPDQSERMRRLRSAILVARAYPATLETSSAADFVDAAGTGRRASHRPVALGHVAVHRTRRAAAHPCPAGSNRSRILAVRPVRLHHVRTPTAGTGGRPAFRGDGPHLARRAGADPRGGAAARRAGAVGPAGVRRPSTRSGRAAVAALIQVSDATEIIDGAVDPVFRRSTHCQGPLRGPSAGPDARQHQVPHGTAMKGHLMRYFCYTMGDESIPMPPPSEQLMTEMDAFIQESIASGVLVATGGFGPSDLGAKVSLADGEFTVTDGPFAEAKELIGGWALIDVDSKEEALESVKRFLTIVGGGESRIRQVFGPED